MALLISIIIFIFSIFPFSSNAQAPPSPGYYPSSRVGSIGFNRVFATELQMSNNEEHPGNHDEIDIEFLGTPENEPYVYPRKSDETFPLRPMWLHGSIWDASSWATDNGRYKADYTYQPFIAKYNNFKIDGCEGGRGGECRPISGSPGGSDGLSSQQRAALAFVNHNYKVYDYCRDPKRDHKLTPECL
ncbi:hypothetical protein SASPL_137609 [Salvia splendens]|uniref:xyloglucan:xyloglucosyl transferase n=1 Tax=Salvia splendens TaxID=180675 RepID=A0A8X8ZDC4_SALSN|nr:hypothetical protein SASPL_137609 [Salvia splendens]